MFERFKKNIILFIIFLFSIITASAVCSTQPYFVDVQSGGSGYYAYNVSDVIGIKNNLNENKLQLKFIFKSDEQSCLTPEDSDKISLRLLNSGISNQPMSIISDEELNGKYLTEVYFEFDFQGNLPSYFNPRLTVTDDNDQQTDTYLNFQIDEQAPTIDVKTKSPDVQLIAPNTSIRINLDVKDEISGLKSLVINDDVTEFSGNKTYTYLKEEELFNSKTYNISVRDRLGFSKQEEISFIVDKTAPQLIENTFRKVYSNQGGTQRVTFNFHIEDESFNYSDDSPDASGNFEQFNSDYTSVRASSCERIDDITFKCIWDNLLITEEETKNVNIGFRIEDSLGNSKTYTKTQEIFVANNGPQFEEFYAINSLDIKNKISYNSSEILVFFKIKDDTLRFNNGAMINVNEIFDPILNVEEPKCRKNIEQRTWECTYNLTNQLDNLNLDVNNARIPFTVGVRDSFSNSNQKTINVTLDNKKPVIEELNIRKIADINQGVFTSGDRINIELFINESNLFYDNSNDNHFVFADFSQISSNPQDELTKAVCQSQSGNMNRCSFNSIRLKNGYFKRNISFSISDISGNTVNLFEEIEVLSKGEEEEDMYKIDDIQILAPINRNTIKSSKETPAWFSGNVKMTVNEPDIELVNFQFTQQTCDNIDIQYIEGPDLYPQDIYYERDGKNETEFAFSFELDRHSNIPDLLPITTNCSISLVKKDNTTLYPPEIINFSITFDFYDNPYGGSITPAHAQKVLELIDETIATNDWFEKVYEVYEMASKICNTLQTTNGILSTISNVWIYASIVLHATGFGTAVATPTDNALFGVTGKVSSFTNSPIIKGMCDWVTCSNSDFIGGGGADFLGISSSLGAVQNDISQGVCSFEITGSSNEDTDINNMGAIP